MAWAVGSRSCGGLSMCGPCVPEGDFKTRFNLIWFEFLGGRRPRGHKRSNKCHKRPAKGVYISDKCRNVKSTPSEVFTANGTIFPVSGVIAVGTCRKREGPRRSKRPTGGPVCTTTRRLPGLIQAISEPQSGEAEPEASRGGAPYVIGLTRYSLSPAVIWVAERFASVAPAASGHTQPVNSGTS